MPKTGFNFQKKREWRGWGAKREWPVLNPEPDDPTVLANVNTTNNTSPLQFTWALIGNAGSSKTINTGILNTTFTPADGYIVIECSDDFQAAAWLATTSHTFIFPRAGLVIMNVNIAWDGNNVGSRAVELATSHTGNEFAYLATNLFHQDRMIVTTLDRVDAGDFGDVTVNQDSGANRTCDIDDLYVYYLPFQGGGPKF